MIVFAVLVASSLAIGALNISDPAFDSQLLLQTRLPRTMAAILSGAVLAIAGVIMQSMARNRFVEPGTTGAIEWAILGMLCWILFAPQTPIWIQLIVAVLFSLIGTFIYFVLLRSVPSSSPLMAPLIGIIYAGIIGALVSLIAIHFDLLEFVWLWVQGDFSMIMQGRYELLFFTAILAFLAYRWADYLTAMNLSSSIAQNIGMNTQVIFALAILAVATIAGTTAVMVGILPFVGLVVPNIVRLFLGDNLRKTLPWIAVLGAIFVLFCDVMARLMVPPFEMPVGLVMGAIGCPIFLWILYRQVKRV